jgi:hypothetical protein
MGKERKMRCKENWKEEDNEKGGEKYYGGKNREEMEKMMEQGKEKKEREI